MTGVFIFGSISTGATGFGAEIGGNPPGLLKGIGCFGRVLEKAGFGADGSLGCVLFETGFETWGWILTAFGIVTLGTGTVIGGGNVIPADGRSLGS